MPALEEENAESEENTESEENAESRKMLIEEQLSRNIQFFGPEGQERLENAFVVVVGTGGVGSHAAHLLARSGVRRLRVIDFDNVSLSSLNRHAVATRADVGTPKVEAMRLHIEAFAPFCKVEASNQMFSKSSAEELLSGPVDFVLDCIDDVVTKLDLLSYCAKKGIPVLSSMGAGAKADPTRLHFTSLGDVVRDPLASKLRSEMRKFDNALSMEKIEVLYSSEKPRMKLLPLSEEDSKLDPSELGLVPNFRIRVIPVLGMMPAIFGMAMASRVATNLAGKPFSPTTIPPMNPRTPHKMNQKLNNRIDKRYGPHAARGAAEVKSARSLDDADVEAVLSAFHCKCVLTKLKITCAGSRLELTLWRYDKPCDVDNLVVCSPDSIERIDALAAEKRLPTALDLGISEESFQDILEGLYYLWTPDTKRLERKYDREFRATCKREVDHLNQTRHKECLLLAKTYGRVPGANAAELLRISRFGMVFSCSTGSARKKQAAYVQFSSPLLMPLEIRGNFEKLSQQAAKYHGAQ